MCIKTGRYQIEALSIQGKAQYLQIHVCTSMVSISVLRYCKQNT